MKIKVQYLGPIRIIINKQEEEVEITPKTTVLQLLKKLVNAYGRTFKREVFEEASEELLEGLIITINGKAVGQLNGTKTELKPGDAVALLPLFTGGG